MVYRKLYVIGNGFDRHHEIESGYEGFKVFVEMRNKELFNQIDTYLPVGAEWWELEAALSDLDIENIVDDNSHFMVPYGADGWRESAHEDFQYEIQRVVSCLSTDLRAEFSRWVRQLEIPRSLSAKLRLQSLDKAGLFFSFNYTPTLVDIYDVPEANILYIHGRASDAEAQLILGHGWSPLKRSSLNDRPDIARLDTRLVEANNILDKHFSDTFKPTEGIIQTNDAFFDSLSDIDEVVVLGHSLSMIDQPYFHAILRAGSVAEAQWIVACQNEAEKVDKANLLHLMAGVKPECIKAKLWDDL